MYTAQRANQFRETLYYSYYVEEKITNPLCSTLRQSQVTSHASEIASMSSSSSMHAFWMGSADAAAGWCWVAYGGRLQGELFITIYNEHAMIKLMTVASQSSPATGFLTFKVS